jgi:hypothetical protein
MLNECGYVTQKEPIFHFPFDIFHLPFDSSERSPIHGDALQLRDWFQWAKSAFTFAMARYQGSVSNFDTPKMANEKCQMENGKSPRFLFPLPPSFCRYHFTVPSFVVSISASAIWGISPKRNPLMLSNRKF